MKNRTVVIRKKSCNWQPKIKRKIQKQAQPKTAFKLKNAGFINPVLIVAACAVFFGFLYLYSINQTATKGIEIHNAEKQVAQVENENESLKIKEAQLESLYQIQDASQNLNMVNVDHSDYVEQNPSVAYSPNKGENSK
jgi:spore maturation protein CgeB